MSTHKKAPAAPASFMDRAMPLAVRLVLILLMGLIPTSYVLKHKRPDSGFTCLILFGKEFALRQVPEVKALHPAEDSPWGYDGQFYAQMAADPLLTEVLAHHSTDGLTFRGQRIFVPALSYFLALGNRGAAVEVYAVINLGFWFFLMGGLIYFLKATSPRQYLCIAAILLSTGALISIQRSLTDLPMATLGFYGIAMAGTSSAVMIGLSILAKPTGGLFLLKYAWPLPGNLREFRARVLYGVIALAPAGLWALYIYHLVGGVPTSSGNITWPFMAWADATARNWLAWRDVPYQLLFKDVTPWEWRMFEFLAPISMMFQAFYLALRRDPRSGYWWVGIGFAALFICLSHDSFAEQIAITRDALPMAIAFNILLLRERGRVYALGFLAGNLGLFWCLRDTLLTSLA